jgi:hypothetical protein
VAGELGTWRDLEAGAPVRARLGEARLRDVGVALLGTLREDSAPRISPVEPYLVEGELLLGAMAWSRKVDDLRRDPRCVLHSAVTGADSGEGELKVYGRAVEAEQELRDAAAEAWWSDWPTEKAVVFSVLAAQAVFVEWDLSNAQMTVHRWSPRTGYGRHSRSYP